MSDARTLDVEVGTEAVALWAIDGRRWSIDPEPPIREPLPPHAGHALPVDGGYVAR